MNLTSVSRSCKLALEALVGRAMAKAKVAEGHILRFETRRAAVELVKEDDKEEKNEEIRNIKTFRATIAG